MDGCVETDRHRHEVGGGLTYVGGDSQANDTMLAQSAEIAVLRAEVERLRGQFELAGHYMEEVAELRARADRYRKALEDAPHHADCHHSLAHDGNICFRAPEPCPGCNCWFLALIEETVKRGDGKPKWYAREFNEAIAIGNRWYAAQPWWRRWWIDAKSYADEIVFWWRTL
jgi:hypothetical protein